MTDYLIICVDRSGDYWEHSHITRVGVQPITGGNRKILKVKEVRQQIKQKTNVFFSEDLAKQRVAVRRYRCKCGRGTIRTGPDDIRDNNLSTKGRCGA